MFKSKFKKGGQTVVTINRLRTNDTTHDPDYDDGIPEPYSESAPDSRNLQSTQQYNIPNGQRADFSLLSYSGDNASYYEACASPSGQPVGTSGDLSRHLTNQTLHPHQANYPQPGYPQQQNYVLQNGPNTQPWSAPQPSYPQYNNSNQLYQGVYNSSTPPLPTYLPPHPSSSPGSNYPHTIGYGSPPPQQPTFDAPSTSTRAQTFAYGQNYSEQMQRTWSEPLHVHGTPMCQLHPDQIAGSCFWCNPRPT